MARRSTSRSEGHGTRKARPGAAAGSTAQRRRATDELAALPVEVLDPRRSGRPLRPRELDLVAGRLARALSDGATDPEALQRLHAVAVCPGDVIARVIAKADDAAKTPPPTCGQHVTRGDGDAYRARRYGYVGYVDGALTVLSPLVLDEDAMHLHWLLLDDRPHPVTLDMLQECAGDLGVQLPASSDAARELVDAAQRGQAQRGRHEIAAGTGPANGHSGLRELLVNLDGRAGEVQPDGSIDFRQTDAIPMVEAGQTLARWRQGAPTQPGRDLKGRVLPGEDQTTPTFVAGDNVEAEEAHDATLFRSTIDGAVRLEGDTLSVSSSLCIPGDVNFETGNLDFDGEIFVAGSVTQGFAVAARGPITIGGAVEPGGTVTSAADVTVGKGIVGQKTRVRSGGNLRAQFVHEARVNVAGDVRLGAYAYNAAIQCGGLLTVTQGSGSRGGSIIGGRIWAHGGVRTVDLGAPAHTNTTVAAGIQPEQLRDLEQTATGIEASHQHILRLLRGFGLSRVDVPQIRKLIQASTGPQRKLLANRARQLGQLAKVYQEAVAHREKLEAAIRERAGDAAIACSGTAFPGVEVRVGSHARVLDREVTAAHFHTVEGRLCERLARHGCE